MKNNSRIGMLDLWQITFFILKMLGVVDWKWGVVFLPYIILLSILFIVSLIENLPKDKKNKDFKLKRGE